MNSDMRSSTHILDKLTQDHPEACRLMVELVTVIDREKRQVELASDHPRSEVVMFDLSGCRSAFETTLENLAMSDATPIEFDHGASVMMNFFSSLAERGYGLASSPLSNAEQKELFAKVIEVGVEVEVKDPGPRSAYDSAFVGTVSSVADIGNRNIKVEDLDGDQFDVELHEIAAVND